MHRNRWRSLRIQESTSTLRTIYGTNGANNFLTMHPILATSCVAETQAGSDEFSSEMYTLLAEHLTEFIQIPIVLGFVPRLSYNKSALPAVL